MSMYGVRSHTESLGLFFIMAKRNNSNLIDLTNQKFGWFTAVEHIGKSRWRCICDCGQERVCYSLQLRNGTHKSCGCKRKEQFRNFIPHNKSHGMTHTAEFNIWSMMKNRCTNPNCNRRHIYLDKGIKVCDRWNGKDGFINFITDMGMCPSRSHSIDRIDTNGNYEPSNCRWATKKEQNNNQISNVNIEYRGEIKTLAQWCELLNLDYKMVHARYRSGKNPDECFSFVKNSNYSRIEINGQTKTIAGWCRIYDINSSCVRARLGRGMGIVAALTTPIKR